MRARKHRPFAERVPARQPITAELLAVATAAPIELAEQLHTAWFDLAETIVERAFVVVFDQFVIGPPEPLLLEAVHHLRQVRRDERRGLFDDERARWYDDDDDDDDVDDDDDAPLTLEQRALLAMRPGWQGDRVIAGSTLSWIVARDLHTDRAQVIERIRLEFTLQGLLADLADAVRIGRAAVVDARLPFELEDHWRWAA